MVMEMELWRTLEDIFKNREGKVENIEIIEVNEIPSEENMKLEVGRWYRIKNVVSLYIDMKGSTQLSNEKFIKT